MSKYIKDVYLNEKDEDNDGIIDKSYVHYRVEEDTLNTIYSVYKDKEIAVDDNYKKRGVQENWDKILSDLKIQEGIL